MIRHKVGTLVGCVDRLDVQREGALETVSVQNALS